MSDPTLIKRAAIAFGRQDFAAAERDCRTLLARDADDADALHLLGLVLRQAGDPSAAESLLRRSIELRPRRAELRVNLSNLLSAAGKFVEAAEQLRAALAAEPGSRPARLALARVLLRGGDYAAAEATGRLLLDLNARDAQAWAAVAAAQREQGRLDDAEASFRKALAIDPGYAVARHNLGALLGRLHRAEESLNELEHAARLGVAGIELAINTARALMDLARLEEAEDLLAAAVAANPGSVEAQVLLAKLRFMRGDPDFDRSLAAQPGNTALSMAHGDLLRRAGRFDDAELILRRLATLYPDTPEIESSLAVVLQEGGHIAPALMHARAAFRARPDDATMTENLIALLLQSAAVAEAMKLIARQRERSPLDQRWLAYEAIAARMNGDPRFDELYDFERFVQTYQIEPPRGYTSIDVFNATLQSELDPLHAHVAHPLDQSLRNGTQSTRDLLQVSSPAIRALLDCFAAPLDAYRQHLGYAPRHPFLERNRGRARLTGCWSVRLLQSGYHVNHIHPDGWISSAYYVEVPAEVEDSERQSGWIRFGEPRMPTPGLAAEYALRPRAGMLVLFPSYMWHGTVPLASGAPRMTVAFDAVPTAD